MALGLGGHRHRVTRPDLCFDAGVVSRYHHIVGIATACSSNGAMRCEGATVRPVDVPKGDRAQELIAGSTAAVLLRSVGLEPVGPVLWGTAPRSSRSGVYVVETREALREAPIDRVLVEGWLERVPTLHLDGSRPTAARLAERLGEFWVPEQRIVYIGLTTASLDRRVKDYYRTPLGDRKPHAGGHWIRTLRGVGDLDVWWSETDAPGEFEDELLTGFAGLIPKAIRSRVRGSDVALLPFANKQNASGTIRKPHGITASVLGALVPSRSAVPSLRGRDQEQRTRLTAVESHWPPSTKHSRRSPVRRRPGASPPCQPPRSLSVAGFFPTVDSDGASHSGTCSVPAISSTPIRSPTAAGGSHVPMTATDWNGPLQSRHTVGASCRRTWAPA